MQAQDPAPEQVQVQVQVQDPASVQVQVLLHRQAHKPHRSGQSLCGNEPAKYQRR